MRFLVWLLVLVCTACAAQSSQPSPSTPRATSVEKEPESPLLPIYADDLTWGSSDPLVTIVAFLDFAQPESKTRYLELVELLEQHPELRLVVKQAPLPADAEPIAEASLVVADALGPKAAKEFLGMVSDASGAPSKEELAAWALGLAASSEPATRPSAGAARAPGQLQKNLELAVRLEVYETPVLFVNGARVDADSDPDAESADESGFIAVFERELAASRASRQHSPSPELHYARRVEENWSSPIVARPVSAVSMLTGDGPEPSWGSPVAPVTLVEFTDFECPFCARVVPTLAQLKQKYGPKQLRIVFKHNPLPFHRSARPAAEAAVVVFREGGDAAFWSFHARLFENQKALTEENLVRWAREVGVSPSRFRRGRERGNPGAKVDADMELAKKVGASGTPAFRINGVTVSGAQPLDKFSEVIDEQLTKAAELVKQGIPHRDVSAVLTSRQLAAPSVAENSAAEPPEDRTVWRVPISANDPVDGPADALVTLIEFSDLQCPFCKRVQPTLKALQTKYGADLRIVWKDNPLPFHPRAKSAATVARSMYERAGAVAFWRAIDAIFEAQPKLEDDDLKQVVEALGGSWQHALSAVQSDRYASKFTESQELAGDYQARGTPHFFINGVRLSGAQPLEKFQALIDDQLKKARVLLAAGIPRSKIFETVMSGAQEPPGPEKKQVAAPVGGAPFRGPAKAKVVIQIFSDFQCPFCTRVNPTLDAILKAQPGVKLVWRNLPLPFHKDADLAAQAAHEVFSQLGNQGFWRYHKLLFDAQQQPDGLSRPNLETLAKQVGANLARFRAALDSEKHRARIEADKTAAQAAGILGTPSFVIGDYFLSGAQPQAEFEKMIRRVQTGR